MNRVLGLSLVGFGEREAVRNHQERFPSLQWELSYRMSRQFLSEVESVIAGRVVSVHACCPAEPMFPNFGSRDETVLKESFEALNRTFETAKRFKAEIVVLHPGYVTDMRIPASNAEREELLAGSDFAPHVGVKEGSICRADYPESAVYRQHFEQAKAALVTLGAMAREKGLRLAAENLNPRVAYLAQTPEDMVSLANASDDLFLCLDVGHLWIASQVYGFDYLEGIREILATGKVVTTHVHSNPSDRKREIFLDSHDGIDRNSFDRHTILDLLAESGANVILETVNAPERNTLLLYEAVG
ncbi:MAG: sugar phosphate isomerase/epimerase [Spirochaetales bacterium]|nr:sugar phosphate isomerase/epimerase [Spirochaetales bacterium]